MSSRTPKRTRSRTLFRALFSGLVGRSVALITPLVIMAPMLNKLGPDLFGMWLTAVSLSAMASFLDFGIGNAALTRLSEAYGHDDFTALRRILAEAYVLLCAITAIGLVLIGAGTVLAAQSADTDNVLVMAIVLANLLLSFPLSLIGRLLQARHAFIQAQLAQIAGPLAAMMGCLIGIRVEAKPTVVVALYALAPSVALLIWTLIYFAAKTTHRPQFHGLQWQSMRSLLGLGGAYFVLSIFSLSGMNVDNVILAARVGAQTVAEFGVPAKLGSILMLIVGTVFMPLWPLFGDAMARKDHAWLRNTTRRMSLGGAAVVFALGIAMTAFANPILTAWMGRAFAYQHLILLGWTLAATVIALTAPYNMVLNAAGQARPQILPWAVFVVASIGAKVMLISDSTVWWAPWITAIVYAVVIAPRMIWLARRVISNIQM